MSHPLEPPRAYQGHLYIYKTYLYTRPEYDVKLLISLPLIQPMSTTYKHKPSPYIIIHNKQTEYWENYLTESGTADSLSALKLHNPAICARNRACDWLDKYIMAGEIKALFISY